MPSEPSFDVITGEQYYTRKLPNYTMFKFVGDKPPCIRLPKSDFDSDLVISWGNYLGIQ